MRDLYELGDLNRPEYIARRDAINTEFAALTPDPLRDLLLVAGLGIEVSCAARCYWSSWTRGCLRRM
jgi:hypothetical protein